MSKIIYTAFREATEIPKGLVEEVRQRFLEEVNQRPDLYYGQDVDSIRVSDWSIQRFLLISKNNTDLALKRLINAFQWRKSFGVLDLSDKDFPQELYRTGYCFVAGHDLNGAPVLIFRGNINRKIKSWTQTTKRFFVHQIEKMDKNNCGKGLTMLMDCKGASIKNVDSEALQFLTNLFKDYYPRLLTATLIHKLPPVLETIHKLVQSWLSEDEKKYLHLTNKTNIFNFIAIQQLPDFLKGTNTLSYRTVPTNAPTAEELAQKLGLKEGKAEKFTKHYEQYFNS